MAFIPIESATVCEGKIKTNLRFSYGEVSHFPFTVVELRSGKYTGAGEGLVNNWKLFERGIGGILGRDGASLEKILPSCLDGRDCIVVREAISIALYSLVSARYNVPLHVLLGGKKRSRVPLLPCIFSSDPSEAGKKARKFFAQGYGHFKVKFVGEENEDLEILKAVRKSIGNDAYLQADANCGYKDIDRFLTLLRKFERFGLNVIEDPIKGSLSEYHRLRKETNVKIMVDQKARSLTEVGKVAKYAAADIINQHPCQQGGLGNALKISAAAEAFGMPTMVGGTGFLGIGTAAHQILASVIGLSFPCGELGGFVDHGFEMSIVKKPLAVEGGVVQVPDVAGLGVELDRRKLDRLSERCMNFE